jgi:hypothetical protein
MEPQRSAVETNRQALAASWAGVTVKHWRFLFPANMAMATSSPSPPRCRFEWLRDFMTVIEMGIVLMSERARGVLVHRVRLICA